MTAALWGGHDAAGNPRQPNPKDWRDPRWPHVVPVTLGGHYPSAHAPLTWRGTVAGCVDPNGLPWKVDTRETYPECESRALWCLLDLLVKHPSELPPPRVLEMRRNFGRKSARQIQLWAAHRGFILDRDKDRWARLVCVWWKFERFQVHVAIEPDTGTGKKYFDAPPAAPIDHLSYSTEVSNLLKRSRCALVGVTLRQDPGGLHAYHYTADVRGNEEPHPEIPPGLAWSRVER